MTTNRLSVPLSFDDTSSHLVFDPVRCSRRRTPKRQPRLYSQNCAACHGDKGHGDGPAGKYLKPPPPDFATSLKGKTDDWIAKAIKGGGVAVGESRYHAGISRVSADDQVKALVAYVKSFNP